MLKYTTVESLQPFFNNKQIITSFKLKKYILDFKIKNHKCESCNLTTWLGSPIPLELHHVDGNHYNNNLTNLSLLCPTCHSLEPTFCNKNKQMDLSKENVRKQSEGCLTYKDVFVKLKIRYTGPTYQKIRKILDEVGFKPVQAEKSKDNIVKIKKIRVKKTQEELEIVYRSMSKADWPTDLELENLVWTQSVSKISNQLGITDNALRHRCIRRGIPLPPVGWHRKRAVGQTEYCKCIEEEMRIKNRPLPRKIH